jgi:hypothetical protein
VDEEAFRNGHKYFTLVNDLAPLARAVCWRRSGRDNL